MSRSRGASLAVVLAAVALLMVCAWQAHRTGAASTARQDALSAARTRVPALLSYDKDSLKGDLDRALDQTTGSFTADYRKVLDEVVAPTAKRRGISTEAAVSAAGVVSGDRDRVVVLVFLTQTTSSSTAARNRSSVSGSRVEVTMELSGDTWKVAGLRPV